VVTTPATVPTQECARAALRAQEAWQRRRDQAAADLRAQGFRIIDGSRWPSSEGRGGWRIWDWLTGEVLATGDRIGYGDGRARLEARYPGTRWVHIDVIEMSLPEPESAALPCGLPASLAELVTGWAVGEGPVADVAAWTGLSPAEVEAARR
jgi:hypothetical protein